MKNIRRTLPLILLLTAAVARGQKAYPVDIAPLCAKVPLPQRSSACYAYATKTMDSSTGMINIKDDGPIFKETTDFLEKWTKAMIAATTPYTPAAPSAAQIEQLKQQAMQQAAAAQSNPRQYAAQQMAAQQHAGGRAAPSSADVAVMKLIGQAQQAVGDIGRLSGELGQKLAAIDRSALQKVKYETCPDVRQGSYMGPTCECLKKNELAYQKRRVAAQDTILQKIREVVAGYQSKIITDELIVDKMEQAAQYGDAVTNPAFRHAVVTVQQQAMSGLTVLLGATGSAWDDAAKIYAGQVNAASGASVPCGKKGK